ncbi:hypothetical protein GCM10023081_27660 [Arthrobacter ginkgonis]|uniref:Uncharacterized protein n=1 Tax=Arthrobacter ginkgonis TaxID=1630594 RepID=A0ABP7CHS8_9MICC
MPVLEPGPHKSRLMTAVGLVGPPVTVIGSVLIYFGWVKADAEAREMGLDVALFGYNAQDYLHVGVNHLFVPLIILFALGLGCLGVDRWVVRRIGPSGAPPALRRILRGVGLAGVVIAAAALLVVLIQPVRATLYAPYAVALGVLLAAWALRLHRLAEGERRKPMTFEQRVAEGAVLFALILLLLLWGAQDHAEAVGRRLALDREQHVEELPRAVIYSTVPLDLGPPEITEDTVGTEANPLYRYKGLRLALVSEQRLFFLHDGWTPRNGAVVVLPDDGSVRIEYSR